MKNFVTRIVMALIISANTIFDAIRMVLKNNSPLLTAVGIDNFVEVDQHIADLPDEEYDRVRGRIEKAAEKPYVVNGIKFVPLCHGTNAAKKNLVLFVAEDRYDEAFRFATCGAHLDRAPIAAAKLAAYMGLVLAPQKPLGFPLNPENVVIVDSATRAVKTNGTKDGVTIEEVEINLFDGEGMLHIPSEAQTNWTEEERAAYTARKDFTLRGPWCKGHINTNFNFHKWCKDHGVKSINGKAIEDIYMILDATVFKAPKGAYDNWEEYCQLFHKLNHQFNFILNEDEVKRMSLSYQQFQTLVGCESDVDKGITNEVERINKIYNAPWHLFDSTLANIVGNYPELINAPYFANKAQRAYKRYLYAALGSNLHKVATNHFVAPDPIAFIENACGMEPHGVIGRKYVVCDALPVGESVISRNPSTDAGALCIRINARCAEMNKYAIREDCTTVYVSVHDDMPVRLRLDYDGDHVKVCQQSWYIEAVKKTHEVFDETVDFTTPKQAKAIQTKDSMARYIVGLTKTDKLGYYNNAMAKMLDAGDYDVEHIRYLTKKINVAVDASKHGDDGEVDEIWLNNLSKYKPLYCGYSKLAQNKDAGKYSNKWGKSIASYIGMNIAEKTKEKLDINPNTFDVRHILFGEYELKENGKVQFPTGFMADIKGICVFSGSERGWFQKWADRLNELVTECRKTEDGKKQMAELKAALLVEFEEEFLKLYRANWKKAYDYITASTFTYDFKVNEQGESYARDIAFNAWCFFFAKTVTKFFAKNDAIDHDLIDDATLIIDENEND